MQACTSYSGDVCPIWIVFSNVCIYNSPSIAVALFMCIVQVRFIREIRKNNDKFLKFKNYFHSKICFSRPHIVVLTTYDTGTGSILFGYIHPFPKKLQKFLSKAGRFAYRFLDIQKFHTIPKCIKLFKKVPCLKALKCNKKSKNIFNLPQKVTVFGCLISSQNPNERQLISSPPSKRTI